MGPNGFGANDNRLSREVSQVFRRFQRHSKWVVMTDFTSLEFSSQKREIEAHAVCSSIHSLRMTDVILCVYAGFFGLC